MSLPPARNLLLGTSEYEILSNIPPDRWVTSRMISMETPYTVREISACIRSKLLLKFVQRRESVKGGGYEYRRLPMGRR